MYINLFSSLFRQFVIELLADIRKAAKLLPEESVLKAGGKTEATRSAFGDSFIGRTLPKDRVVYEDDLDMAILETCRVKHGSKMQIRNECEHAILSAQFANNFPKFMRVVEGLKELIAHELRVINKVRSRPGLL